MVADPQKLVDLFEEAQFDRSNWESHWQDVADLVLPTRTFTETKTPGEKRRSKQYDATANKALIRSASMMQGITINPAQRWFMLMFVDDDLNLDREAAEWRDEVEAVMYRLLPRMNFYTHGHEVFLDQMAFGTASMIPLRQPWDKKKPMRIYSRPLREMFLIGDENNEVWGVVRKFEMTPQQMAERFGETKLPRRVLECLRSQNHHQRRRKFDILHYTFPRSEAERVVGKLDGINKPVASIYMVHDGNSKGDPENIVRESGFDEMPYLTPRWSVAPGETYGRSPAMTVLPDIGMINALRRVNIVGAEKAISPPIIVPSNGTEGDIRLSPNAIIRESPAGATGQGIRPLDTGSRIDLGEQILEKERLGIEQAFFLDILELPMQDRMTAEEVRQRVQEKMVEMAPVAARQHDEFLRPLLARLYSVMVEADMIPEPPPHISASEITIEFTSMLAHAQKQAQADRVMQHFNFLSPFAEVDPSVMQGYDLDSLATESAKWFSVPKKVLRDPGALRDLRERIDQQREQAAQAETAQQLADAAEKGSKAVQNASQTQRIAAGAT